MNDNDSQLVSQTTTYSKYFNYTAMVYSTNRTEPTDENPEPHSTNGRAYEVGSGPDHGPPGPEALQ